MTSWRDVYDGVKGLGRDVYESNIFYLLGLGDANAPADELSEIQTVLTKSPLGLVPPTARVDWLGVLSGLAFESPFEAQGGRRKRKDIDFTVKKDFREAWRSLLPYILTVVYVFLAVYGARQLQAMSGS